LLSFLEASAIAFLSTLISIVSSLMTCNASCNLPLRQSGRHDAPIVWHNYFAPCAE
jgi:hypothetical protein